jgi:hypothetical protein
VGDGYAHFRYDLRNVGDIPVKISSIRASCGCAKPTVSPTVVAPGGTAVLRVAVTKPAIGERMVRINLETDSPTRWVELTARLFSSNRPPFMMDASGDLTFFDDEIEEGATGEVVVRTIE